MRREMEVLKYICVSVCVVVTQSCPNLCDPMDCSPPGSSVHGICQARILKWISIPFAKESSQRRDWSRVSCIAGWFLLLNEPHTRVCVCVCVCVSTQTYIYTSFPGGSEGKESARSAGDLDSIPGSGRQPGEGKGNPLQYSCLENPMDGEAW